MSPFELAMQDGIKAITRSVMARSVLYRQGATETTIQAVWREGDNIQTIDPRSYARCLVLESDLPQAPADGDQIDTDGKQYEVRKTERNGVGGWWLYLRFLKDL